MLQREKQYIAKKYEKRMNEIEGNLKAIINNCAHKEVNNKVNNSFCLGKVDDSLLLNP